LYSRGFLTPAYSRIKAQTNRAKKIDNFRFAGHPTGTARVVRRIKAEPSPTQQESSQWPVPTGSVALPQANVAETTALTFLWASIKPTMEQILNSLDIADTNRPWWIEALSHENGTKEMGSLGTTGVLAPSWFDERATLEDVQWPMS
jgi:hypothetical protein